jgi:hypothetical protein
MNSSEVQVVPIQKTLVKRTYQLGLQFVGTKEERRAQEQEANQRVKGLQVQQEDIIYCRKSRKTAMDVARILPEKQAKLAIRSVQEITKNYANISDSAYYWLFLASRGTLVREKRVTDFFNLLKEWNDQAIEWMIFGRSPRVENYLARKWKVGRIFVINLLTSIRRKLDQILPSNLKFNTIYNFLTQNEVEKAISSCYKLKKYELSSYISNSRVKSFLSKIELLFKNIALVAPYITSWNNIDQKSRWKSLKRLSKVIAVELKSEKSNFFSTLRAVVISALSSKIEETVLKIVDSIQLDKIINPPFMRKTKGRLPIILLMKKDYVIVRPGNARKMTDMARTQGRFEFGFTLRKSPKITAFLVFPKKVIEYLQNGANVKILLVKSSPAPSYKIRVSVVLEGSTDMFLSTKLTNQLAKKIRTQQDDVLGLDINRLGEYMLALSNGVRIPKELKILIKRYKHLSSVVIPQLSRSLLNKIKQRKTRNYIKNKGELARVYKKRIKLLSEIKNFSSHFIAAVLVRSKSKLLCIEDLLINPSGSKGPLAKVFYSMVDENYIFVKAVLLASKILNYEIKLVKVNPWNTSVVHNNCGGHIIRSPNYYDISPCNKCRKNVNTHLNAARNIQEKGVQVLKSSNFPSSHARGIGKLPIKHS